MKNRLVENLSLNELLELYNAATCRCDDCTEECENCNFCNILHKARIILESNGVHVE